MLKAFNHYTKLSSERNAVYPHGSPDEDVAAVFKERLTFYEVKDIRLDPADWAEMTVDFDSSIGLITIQANRAALYLGIQFSNYFTPTVLLKRGRPVEITATGSLVFGFSLFGPSEAGLTMTLLLTNEHGALIATSMYNIRAKITSYSSHKSAKRRCRKQAVPKSLAERCETTPEPAATETLGVLTSSLDHIDVNQLWGILL